MKNDKQDELIANVINGITEKLSKVLLQEFLKQSEELQVNIVLIKSAQLLLANVLCHVASTQEELESVADSQGMDMKELTLNCAILGFSEKFGIQKH